MCLVAPEGAAVSHQYSMKAASSDMRVLWWKEADELFLRTLADGT